MVSELYKSDAATAPPAADRRRPLALKVVIAGGFGVGKTTLVGSCSEILPLRTEEHITNASIGTDDLTGVEEKTTTTVVMDFGRIRINDDVALYLFGVDLLFWTHPSSVGIVVSVAICIVAALNLILDFAVIERGVESGAPAAMEWFAAFGLLTTLVWLYLEILYLLIRARAVSQ